MIPKGTIIKLVTFVTLRIEFNNSDCNSFAFLTSFVKRDV